MHTHEVTINYVEPRTAKITVETKDVMSEVEIEDLAMEEFEDQYPEGIEPDVIEVKTIN